jgi:GAF domain-containing protein
MSHHDADNGVTALQRLSRIKFTEHSMQSALQEVADIAKEAIPGASDVSVTVVTRDEADTVVWTGDRAVDADESQYQQGYGPCLATARRGQLHHIDDAAKDDRWGDYAVMAKTMGVLSSVSVPMLVQEEPQVSAALNVYASRPHAFDAEALRVAVEVAGAAEAILANMRAHDSSRALVQHLVHAMGTRALIEQAKGVVMRTRGCSDGEAFAELVTVSQRSNRSLREVAQDLLTSVSLQQHRPV